MPIAPPTPAELERARDLLAGVVRPTPLIPLHGRDDILIKPEILQPTGSFKIRGVFCAVASLDPSARQAGLSTVSAGNTAKALAWTGARFGVPARSLMPKGAPKSKIDAVLGYGGTPVLVETDEVFRFLRERGWTSEPYAFVHPWIDRDVMIGHGTMALEILAERPDVDTVFLPVGGGGLLGGVGGALRALAPRVRIVAVEPEGCPSLHASLAAGRPVSVACRTMCDGVAVPYVTDEMFPLLSELVDDVVLVSEASVRRAIHRLATGDHIVAEGAGALAVAAALEAGERSGAIVCPVTGGSIDPDKLAAILIDSMVQT